MIDWRALTDDGGAHTRGVSAYWFETYVQDRRRPAPTGNSNNDDSESSEETGS